MLYRLMCFMHSTVDHRMFGYVRDPPSQLHLALYVDADFCGDREDAYSTNGGWLVLQGPNTCFPITWVSKKQTSVSRSTTESEIVSLAHSLFLEAMPMCSMFDLLLGRPIDLIIYEDNQATITIAEKGRSNKLRHVSRTHKVNLWSIKDELDKPYCHLKYVESPHQRADVFTKPLDLNKWGAAVDMLNIAREPLKVIDVSSAGLRQEAAGTKASAG